MLIAIDHGNSAIKGLHGRVFPSGLYESTTRPTFENDILKYRGSYYAISDTRIPFLRYVI